MGIGTFLPGGLEVGVGGRGDYDSLARFHYLGGRPAVVAGVWVVRYFEEERRTSNVERSTSTGEERPARGAAKRGGGRVVAVGVLSWPTPRCRGREQVFGLGSLSYRGKILWANQHVRTISRVVVHPQFRGLGLASILVRECCARAGTPYVEALAVMGRAHPFFEKGGMGRVGVEGGKEGDPWYFLWRRGKGK